MRLRYSLTSAIASIAATCSVGCSTKSESLAADSVGVARQAIQQGTLDQGPNANFVVELRYADDAIASRNKKISACTGSLLTPTVLITSRFCASPLLAGLRPKISVDGTSESIRYSIQDVVIRSGNPGDAPTKDESGDLALVYLDPANPVVEAIIPRQLFVTPLTLNPVTDPDFPNEVTVDMGNLGMAGWSDPEGRGSREGNVVSQRYSWSAQVVRLFVASESGSQSGYSLWLRKGGTSPGALQGSDRGGPLYVTDTDGRRQLIGIASTVGAIDGKHAKCPAEVDSCDAWIDLSNPSVAEWIVSQLRESEAAHGEKWKAMHPLLPGAEERWINDADYLGPCKADQDADCDHILDYNPGSNGTKGAQRDNCLKVKNLHQKDVDDDGFGDECAPQCPAGATGRQCDPLTELTPNEENLQETARMYAQGTVTGASTEVSPEGPTVAVKANNTFHANMSANRVGVEALYGNTRLVVCNCSSGQTSCTDPYGKCARRSVMRPAVGTWRGMSIAKLGSNDGPQSTFVKTEHRGTRGKPDTKSEDWSWAYWNDLTDLASPQPSSPQADPSDPGPPIPVFSGTIWPWVKNFSQDSFPDVGGNDDISEPGRAERRQDALYFTLKEQVARAAKRIKIVPIISPSVTTRWPLRPGCPACLPGSIIHFDPRINPDPGLVSVRPGLRTAAEVIGDVSFVAKKLPAFRSRALMAIPSSFAETMPGVSALNVALQRWGRRAIIVGHDASGNVPGEVTLAVINPETHGLLEAYAYAEDRVYEAIQGPMEAPASAFGGPVVAALASHRNELAFFGESVNLARGLDIRTLDLKSKSQQHREAVGLTGTRAVLAVAYSAFDDSYYVLDIGVEANDRFVRLVRVNPRYEATVLGKWKHTVAYDHYELTVGADDTLAITATQGAKHAVLLLNPSFSGVGVRALLTGDQPLAAPAMTTADGLSLVYGSGFSLEPTLTDLNRMNVVGGTAVGRESLQAASLVSTVF